MHFEILVEDQSGKKFLDILVPKIVGTSHSFRVIAYKGLGHIPKNLTAASGVGNRLLLDNLPKLLRGYGKTYAGYPENYSAAVIVVCDLDDKCLKAFRQQLYGILNNCNPKLLARFCIAIEEGEAWLLGDIPAIKSAYPKAKDQALKAYENDSVCGTWECLANAVYPGGEKALAKGGWQGVGRQKSIWAEKIAPRMDVESNKSPSFRYFKDTLRCLSQQAEGQAQQKA